ncbi:MAG: hypothetical protein JW801_02105 [Bacteroidales bacterium]|nr:hypothetical protein [Bacteroidales bacterium]
MKNFRTLLLVVTMVAFVAPVTVSAQEEEESGSSFSVGADLVSRYVWRGTDFGNSPAIQPGVSFSKGGFEVGAWGSYSFSSNTGGAEADLYAGYSFDFGLSLGVTDYYFPGESLDITGMVDSMGTMIGTLSPSRSGAYFSGDAHAIEIAAGYEIGNLSLLAGYFLSGDIYGEVGYSFGDVSVFVGAGNGAYTLDGGFMVCNVGIGVEKEIAITESFSIPMFGQLILNPDSKQVHWVVGVSF